jgi:xanthine dehydrogenase accessory factor
MNYHVIAVAEKGSPGLLPYADETLPDLKTIGQAIRPFTYVVVATHGNYDEPALELILRARPSYVGLVASPTRGEAVRTGLLEKGFSETDLLPLKIPAGLDIQARRGDEIALSIMAEIVHKRRNAELLDLQLFRETEEHSGTTYEGNASVPTQSGADWNPRLQGAQPEAPAIAVDPVCGMDVEIATAMHVSEYAGDRYYFCCSGCKSSFERNPQRYLGTSAVDTERVRPARPGHVSLDAIDVEPH